MKCSEELKIEMAKLNKIWEEKFKQFDLERKKHLDEIQKNLDKIENTIEEKVVTKK
ncbi:hypothetical protein [Spiroplasma alleghenense]|uniref:Uncharacterized protein n=1 Tax=Spiroplasma alleghenense TaxID=216931 RepID=A0A345Z518_9MOLU|nr:hypothetical protein [Spiroplasma alleghenense]AXK51697.1 hypothetical protein SALLE_v1c10270 [Spiroplasma alleghenense]